MAKLLSYEISYQVEGIEGDLEDKKREGLINIDNIISIEKFTNQKSKIYSFNIHMIEEPLSFFFIEEQERDYVYIDIIYEIKNLIESQNGTGFFNYDYRKEKEDKTEWNYYLMI